MMWDMYEAWLYQIVKIPKKRRMVLLGWQDQIDERKIENADSDDAERYEQMNLFEDVEQKSERYDSEYAVGKLCKLDGAARKVYITNVYKKHGIAEKYADSDTELIEQELRQVTPEKLFAEYQSKGITFLSYRSDLYPKSLHNIHDRPAALYQIQGGNAQQKISADAPVVAIIGARECTEYGAYVARELGKLCARYGIHVVSGLAYGIDSIAQKAARTYDGMVTAVLGSGPDVCYPAANQGLYDDLVQNGCILSEYAPGTQPKPQLFPPRNRIISGLSDAVIVVEAKKKSGTLITVDMALEQGKDVYVVPGRLTDAMSYGCNRLVSQGAGIVYDMEAVIDEIRCKKLAGKAVFNPGNDRFKNDMDKTDLYQDNGMSSQNGAGAMNVVAGLYGINSLECLVFQKISVKALNVDQILSVISRERDVTYQQLVSMLLVMEMDGVIYEEAGRYAARIFS